MTDHRGIRAGMRTTQSGVPLAFVFELPEGHPDSQVVATLRVVCPHHPEQVLVEHRLTAGGTTCVAMVRGYSEESVAAPEAGLERLQGLDLPPEHRPVAQAVQGRGYLRAQYRCPRPSCKYDAQMRLTGPGGLGEFLDDKLRLMCELGTPFAEVSNLERMWGGPME